MKTYKTYKKLQEGNCIVVGKNRINGRLKEFEGIFNSELQVVFLTISSLYEIIEYRQ